MDGVDEQLAVDPEFDSGEAADPEAERSESADEAGELGEAAFNGQSSTVEVSAEVRPQQFQPAQAMRAVTPTPQSTPRALQMD